MSSRAWIAVLPAALACNASKPLPLTPPIAEDAGLPPGAKPITVTAIAPRTTNTGGKTNANWAAFRKDDTSWVKIVPTELGVYSFYTLTDKWALALVCADRENSLVVVHEDSVSVNALELTLERWCGTPGDVYTLTGTLSSVPATTGWLEFGYALEVRGVTFGVVGSAGMYEEVNVAAGTWDMLFGLRDSSFSGLTRVAVVRGHALVADGTLDVDFGGGFAPGGSKLVVHGIDPQAERASATMFYTTNGGMRGLDVGSKTTANGGDVEVPYATVPAAAQIDPDRYRAEVTVVGGADEETSRGATTSFHTAADLDLTLLPALAPPAVTVVGTKPYLRVAAAMPVHPTASAYEVVALEKITNRSQRAWRMTIGATAVSTGEVSVAIPDLSAVAGFDASWALVGDQRRYVSMKIREKATPFGDGTAEAFAAHTVITEP